MLKISAFFLNTSRSSFQGIHLHLMKCFIVCVSSFIFYVFYVHGSMHRESMSITVQQDATIYSLLYLCKLLALHVSGGNSTHHQEHI